MTREQVNDPALLEGDRVTVTLTGEVVGRGVTFLTIKVDGQEDKMFGAEKLIYIWRENDAVEVIKHDPREIRAGDRVRLTGENWKEWDAQGKIVTVASISQWGEPEFDSLSGDGGRFAIFKNQNWDYSAERVID